MFTKQHYIEIAKIIKRKKITSSNVLKPVINSTIEFLAKDLSTYFSQVNKNFDEVEFMKLCGC